jgi:transketolase
MIPVLTDASPARVAVEASLRHAIKVARRAILDMHFRAGIGHLGGNLSCIDALIVLYQAVLAKDDLFVLSKGHSAGALYVALWSVGKFTDNDLSTFHGEGTLLAGHPPSSGVEGLRFATGSLGHGLSLAAGLALAMHLRGRQRRIFCLTSDGEWQEGSTWEALIFAAHHALGNLTVMIDANGLQGFGATREVASLEDLGKRLASFQWDVETVDGHDPGAILAALEPPRRMRPKAVILRTVKGKGVARFEGRLESHYLPLTKADYDNACLDLDRHA